MVGELLDSATGVSTWLNQRRSTCALALTPMDMDDSPAWRHANGRIVHRSGGFFSLVGQRLRQAGPSALEHEQPIIDQPEVGILGFIVRRTPGGHDWLLQAKTEPGSVLATQLAPTVQATVSNYTGIHGGGPTAFLEAFVNPARAAERVRDCLQSEQGNRFLAKYNRNVTVLADGKNLDIPNAAWRWCTAPALRSMLLLNYTVNTDARSVLLCSDWQFLADGDAPPFSRWRSRGGWEEGLWDSSRLLHPDSSRVLDVLQAHRARLRRHIDIVPLDALRDWRVVPQGLSHRAPGQGLVAQFAVSLADREVSAWDQPLWIGQEQGLSIMLCQMRNGVLEFLLRASTEPGFVEGVQFGPSFQSDSADSAGPDAQAVLCAAQDGVVRAEVTQSDEGGRFLHSVMTYRIVELAPGTPLDDRQIGVWASLSEIRQLCLVAGALTNEARSVMSLVLAWA